MPYAHALIEVRNEDESVTKYDRGDEIPEDIDGYDELVEGGAIRDEPYDPDSEPKQVPEYVDIDGVRYYKEATDEDD